MSGDDAWAEMFSALQKAALFPQRSAHQKLMALDSIEPIIRAAKSTKTVGLLDDAMLTKLMEIAGLSLGSPAAAEPSQEQQEHGVAHDRIATPKLVESTQQLPPNQQFDTGLAERTDGHTKETERSEHSQRETKVAGGRQHEIPQKRETERSVDEKSDLKSSNIGRTIAPINAPELKPAARPHGLPHARISDFGMLAKDIDMELDIHFDITGRSVTEGRMDDMLSCFNDRLKTIKRLLIQGRLPSRPISVAELVSGNRHRDDSATIIGLVDDPKHTKNGHLLFSLEDDTASVRCLCRLTENAGNNHPVNAGLMPDDAIGVTGRFARDGDLLIVDDIHFPPMARHEKSRAGVDASVSAAFLSDIHLGSRTFLRPQWQKLVEWFHNDPIAQTVKYFVLSGDGVDGIGIYPGQEKELMITNLFDQYSELAKLLEVLPDHIEVMLLPGNHDAVRPAEPQPALDPEVQTDYNNTTFVGNPCDFSLHGVRILSYHGKSIDDFVAQLRSVSYAKPETAMRAMLERRHLAPSWGGKTPLSPEPEDRLVIPVIPDIFVTGHVHGHFVGEHKGVTMVQSSTWQNQTSYQRMLGFQPKPCMLTVINLHTHASTTIPFA